MTNKKHQPPLRRSKRWLNTSLGAVAIGVMVASGAAWADEPWPEPMCIPEKQYDIITSTFHTSVAQMSDGGWKAWGEAGNPQSGNVAPPVDIKLPEEADGQPKAYLATAASQNNGTDKVQIVVLGNNGAFYSYGGGGIVINGGGGSISKVADLTLPIDPGTSAPYTADQVVMMAASYHVLTMVTDDGNAWVLRNGSNASLAANGASPGTGWQRVMKDPTTPLKGVIALRVWVDNSNNGAAIALTDDGYGNREVYTWGNRSRAVNADSSVTDHNYAHQLDLPGLADGVPKQIGVTGRSGQADSTAFYVLYAEKDAAGNAITTTNFNSYKALDISNATGTLYALGRNNEKQLGDAGTTSRNTWAALKKPVSFDQITGIWSDYTDTFDDVRMFSVQEHDSGGSFSTGSGGLITANGDVWTWGSNNGTMIGGKQGDFTGATTNTYSNEGKDSLDPGIRGYLMASKGQGSINARYIEMGGHTTAFLPGKKPQYCYVGHQTNGSMGDSVTANKQDMWQTQCDGTAAIMLCGSDALLAEDDIYAPITVPETATVLGNAYDNDEWQGEQASTVIKPDSTGTAPGGKSSGIFGEILEYATSSNWGPVPYLDVATGDVIAPPGTYPGDYTIKYRIRDDVFGETIYADAFITVSVKGIKAIPDTDTTTVGVSVKTSVTDNDTSPSGVSINKDSVKKASPPSNGTVTCFADQPNTLTAGQCEYTPNPGFKGTDTYTYEVCNTAEECDTTTVTIAVGEPPRIIANDDVGLTSVNVPLRMPVLGNDIPVAGKLNPASVAPKGSITGGPEDANSTVTCASDGYCIFEADKPGTYTYEYEVCLAEPNNDVCDTAKVTVTVPEQSGTSGDPDNPLVDKPTIVAGSDYDTTGKNTSVTTTVTGNDWASGGVLDPDSVNPVGSSSANGGTVTQDGSGRIKYTPKTDFVGVDTYEYRVCLAAPTNECTTTTVQVKVGDPAIQAVDDKTGPNQPYPVGGNDEAKDGDLDKGSVKVITPPVNGEADCEDGLCTYTPNKPDNPVDDEYKYEVCLVGMPDICSTATVQILNMTAVGDEKNLGSEWTSITIEAGENDFCPVTPYVKEQPKELCGSDNLTLTVFQDGDSAPISNKDWFAPEFGAVVIDEDTGLPIYTPDPDSFKGEDKFTYLACTKEYPGVCDVATVTIKGTPKMVPELDLPPGAVGVEYPGGKLSCTNEGTAAATDAACSVSHLPPGLKLEQCTLNGVNWNQPGKVEIGETVECLITGTPTQPTEKPEEGTPPTPPTGETGFGGCSASGTSDCTEKEDTPATGTDPDNPDDKPGEITNKMKAVNDKDTLKSFTGVTTSVFPNDLDSEGKLLVSTVGKLTENSDGAHGTVSCTVAGECTYTPGDTWDGEDNYTYKVCLIAAPAVCDTATVTIVGEPKMVPDLLLPKIVPDVPYEGTLVCTNEGTAAATDVICKVDHETIPPGLTVEYDNCTVQPPLPATAWQDGDSVKIGQKVECPITGIPGEKDQFDPDNPPKGETVWKDPNKPAEDPKRAEVIKEPGILKIVKTVYEGHNSGASCSAAKPELLIVEKDPKMHDLTWCFTVTNNGDQPLGVPIWEDSAYPYMEPTLLNGTLPLAAGQIAVWYFEAKHDRSVVNTVGLEMPVVDASCVGPDVAACEPVDVPPAYNFDNSTATFGMIYDPPFGVKVGTAEGFDTIQWTMVWVNDNAVAAKSVEVSDVIQEPMQFAGELVCQGAGDTQVVADSCVYDETTRKVSVTADFASDLGKTIANAEHPLYISFNVKVPVKPGKSETYENIAEATWQPTDPDSGEPVGEELHGKTTYVPELGIAPPPQEGEPPVITPPTGVDPNDPEGPLGHEPKDEDGNPLPPGPDGTPVDVTAPPVAPVPVDNPFALILLALGLLGLGARYARKRSAA